jgi:hypothetical protein
MFIHPDCPCTRASLAELGQIDPWGARILVVADGLGDMWDEGARLGFTLVLDPAGLEATRFGARTSGHVVAYDAHGTLRYSGGITGSRGHVGDNVGRRTLQAILAGNGDHDVHHPVFGCGL